VLANNVPLVSELLVQTPSSSSIRNAMYLPDVKSLTANRKHLFAQPKPKPIACTTVPVEIASIFWAQLPHKQPDWSPPNFF
jgi:hypothetical protein